MGPRRLDVEKSFLGVQIRSAAVIPTDSVTKAAATAEPFAVAITITAEPACPEGEPFAEVHTLETLDHLVSLLL